MKKVSNPEILAQLEAEGAHEDLQMRSQAALISVKPAFCGMLGSLAGILETWFSHQGFWSPEAVGTNPIQQRQIKIGLMHTELSEMFEGLRGIKLLDGQIEEYPMDNHCPELTSEEAEAADVLVRLLDYCGHYRIDLGDAFATKMLYNLSRPYKHGKAN